MIQKELETMSKKSIAVLIVAAGQSKRLGDDIPKQYQVLGDVSVLTRTLTPFVNHDRISSIVCVINESHRAFYDAATVGFTLESPVNGGDTRQQSVYNGLKALQKTNPDYVLIHDAARPFITESLINGLITALESGHKAVLPCLPVVDTLKRVENGLVQETVSREQLYRAQTPQAFCYKTILSAHESHKNQSVTDDVALMELVSIETKSILGSEDNIKLTYPSDFEKARERIMQKPQDIRMGQGFDVHRFEDGDHLWLCGVKIPHTKGLKGHSDADVAMHALTDALYGSIAAGDIGVHFPPSEGTWKNAESHIFLSHAAAMVQEKGGVINNIDITIICEEPKIAPHQSAMRQRLASILNIPADKISVKATTTEKLGFTGRGEGIAAQALVTIALSN